MTAKALIVYSSRPATENTRKVAEAIARELGPDCDLVPAAEAPSPDGYAFVGLGFGVYRGWPDGDMRAYMKKCRNLDVGLFLTLGAYPDSDHAFTCMGRAEGLLPTCRVKARFIGHGRLDPAAVARMKERPAGAPHCWDEERAARISAAQNHPDAADLVHASTVFKAAWEKIRSGATPARVKTPRNAILLVAFGSSVPTALRAYDRIESLTVAAHPDTPVFRAYTSAVVRRKLAATGSPVESVGGALNRLYLDGFTGVRIIPLYIVPGEEYHKLAAEVDAFRNAAMGFDEITLCRPLLAGADRLDELVAALASILPAERRPEDAVVFMGHGNHHGNCDFHYLALAERLRRHDPRFLLATVEGAAAFDAVRGQLRSDGIRRAFLLPFMTVAGDHAVNDLAGPQPDSWRSQLAADGIDAIPVLKGLGEYDPIAAIFARGDCQS